MLKLITSLRTALENRRAYHRALIEVSLITERELADMRADRDMLVANAHQRVYGDAR